MRSMFALDEPGGRFTPAEVRHQLGIRSSRTLDSYVRQPGFPNGQLEHRGRVLVRTWSAADVVNAEAWLQSRGLPGSRAGHRRIANLDKARFARGELDDLEHLAGRVVRLAGVGALANALRLVPGPLKDLPLGERAAVRAELVATLRHFER